MRQTISVLSFQAHSQVESQRNVLILFSQQSINCIDKIINFTATLRIKELDLLQKMTQLVLAREDTGIHTDEGTTDIDTGQGPATHCEDLCAADTAEASMSYTQILDLAQQLDTVSGSSWGTDFEAEYSNLWM